MKAELEGNILAIEPDSYIYPGNKFLSRYFKFPEQKQITINCGLWEEKECDIIYNYISDEECKHSRVIGSWKFVSENITGSVIHKIMCTPRVLIAMNEEGYNSTGVCIDCLLEGLEAENRK